MSGQRNHHPEERNRLPAILRRHPGLPAEPCWRGGGAGQRYQGTGLTKQ